MKVIANRQLRGNYGLVVPDQEFETTDAIADSLLKRGLVRHAVPPKVQYETKIIKPEAPEVGPREPFRDLPLPDEKSENVASEGDNLLPEPDVSQDRATHPRGRGRRSGSSSEE
jgi:hypothetical protein